MYVTASWTFHTHVHTLCSTVFPPSGPDIPFVAVYKTQRDGESETQDRESECFHRLNHTSAFYCDVTGDLVTS